MKHPKRKVTRPAAIPLPEHIAREIFKFGDLDGKKCHRMAYKVGHWTPDHSEEKENGGLSPSAERYHVLTDTLRGLLQLVEASRRLHDAVSARAATSTPTEHQTWEVFHAHAELGEALDGITPLPEPLLWLKHEQEGSL